MGKRPNLEWIFFQLTSDLILKIVNILNLSNLELFLDLKILLKFFLINIRWGNRINLEEKYFHISILDRFFLNSCDNLPIQGKLQDGILNRRKSVFSKVLFTANEVLQKAIKMERFFCFIFVNFKVTNLE